MAQRALFICIVSVCAVCTVASRTGPATSDLPLRKLTALQAGVYWPTKSCDFVQDDYVQCDGDTPVAACCDKKTCYREHDSGDTITCDNEDYHIVGCCPKPKGLTSSSKNSKDSSQQSKNSSQQSKKSNSDSNSNSNSNSLNTRVINPLNLASGSWQLGRR